MIKFSIPTNWQEDLVTQIKKDSIDEMYGKLAADFVGGIRPSYSLPNVNRDQIGRHIELLHDNGLKFNYLLNAVCLKNREWTISGQKKLNRLLEWLTDIKVDSVTVSIPYLSEVIKKRFPKLQVYVSLMAQVDSLAKVRYWEELGADRITLSDVTREFDLLKEIRKRTKCELQLIANNSCLLNCPFSIYHGVLLSHSSQAPHECKGFVIDYCILTCRYRRILEPVNFIRSDWIRPEDLSYYEDVGIDRIKLVDRCSSTERISLIANAYANRCYKGNLLDLFPTIHRQKSVPKGDLLHSFRYFFRPFSVNIFKLQRIIELVSATQVYVDNQTLCGFLKYFLRGSCRLKSCEECGYCSEIAGQAVKIDPSYRIQILKQYRDVLDDLISSKMFEYGDTQA